VKVARTGLPAAEIGSSAALKVGETVVAVGSPFGLDKTVTSGIVSALHRSNLSAQGGGTISRYTNLIQTDAPINPGNSGGALADLSGRVIGINTLIQSTSGSSAGIGFAIPIDYARSIADQLIKSGKAEHPFLGVSMSTVDASNASQLKLPAGTTGALVESIVAGSPAAKGGIKNGDVVVSFGGEPITSVEDLFAAIRSRQIGQAVDVVVIRGNAKTTVKITLGSDVGQ
jgi:putative serine protease PepD